MKVSKKVILNLIKGGKVPQVFTGQVQVEWTHCSFLRDQQLELEQQTHSYRNMVHKTCEPSDVYSAKQRRTWLLNAASLSFFPKLSSPFWTISFRSGMVSCPRENRTVLFFLARVCNSAALDVTLTTKQTPWQEKKESQLCFCQKKCPKKFNYKATSIFMTCLAHLWPKYIEQTKPCKLRKIKFLQFTEMLIFLYCIKIVPAAFSQLLTSVSHDLTKTQCFFSLRVTDLCKLLWYPIRAELTSAVSDEIHPINQQHQRFFLLHVTQAGVKFWQQISVITSN